MVSFAARIGGILVNKEIHVPGTQDHHSTNWPLEVIDEQRSNSKQESKYKNDIMNDSIENIRRLISSYIEINDVEWEHYSSMFRIETIHKKQIVHKEKTICKNVFFVVSGLLRVYFVDNDGEEKTFHFALENTFATDYESFLKGIPSNYSIQAMEDTTVVLMSLEMLLDGYKSLRYGEKLGRLLAEDYFFIFNDKIRSLYTQSPLERYNNMNVKFPQILQRVPQHYIASYLNISSVHLSRLKHLGIDK